MICIAGKNDIATNVLSFVVKEYGCDEVVAIANRDDTGYVTWQHSLIATAIRLNVRLITLKEAYDISNLHFFSVEFDRIIVPSRFVSAHLYNIHFSLLPAYKGVYTSVWPILNGESTTGVTLHRIEAGIDTGPIIHQQTISIGENENARDVYHKCLATGYEVLAKFIPQLIIHPEPGIRQAILGSTYYSPASINYSALSINLRQTAYQVHNCIRAYSFQEYQLPTVHDSKIRSSRITENISTAKPGMLLRESSNELEISTIDFDMVLYKDYSTELFDAIVDQFLARVLDIIKLVPDLEVRNRKGWTPLMIAAYSGNVGIVSALLDAGANINAVNKKGTSVLMYAKTTASISDNFEVMNILLWRGADAKAVDICGKSVLDYAIIEGNSKVIEIIRKFV